MKSVAAEKRFQVVDLAVIVIEKCSQCIDAGSNFFVPGCADRIPVSTNRQVGRQRLQNDAYGIFGSTSVLCCLDTPAAKALSTYHPE